MRADQTHGLRGGARENIHASNPPLLGRGTRELGRCACVKSRSVCGEIRRMMQGESGVATH